MKLYSNGSSHRRPTASRHRSRGEGNGSVYRGGTGEGFWGYEPVVERSHWDCFGVGGRRRVYEIEESDDE